MTLQELQVLKELVKVINELELVETLFGQATFVAQSATIVEEMDAVVVAANQLIANAVVTE